jgi:hypothetical protein
MYSILNINKNITIKKIPPVLEAYIRPKSETEA